MKISVVFSPVTKVSWRGHKQSTYVSVGPRGPAQGLPGGEDGVLWAQQVTGWGGAVMAVANQGV